MDEGKLNNNSETKLKAKAAEEVDNYVKKRQDKFDTEFIETRKRLNSGAFGTVYLLTTESGAKYISKVLKSRDDDIRNEGVMTKQVGVEGAKKRVLRRLEKGYGSDVRLSGPQVYKIAKNLYMEFMENGDLTNKQKYLDVYDLLKQSAKLLKDLHSDGYIHRDIKAKNLLLGKDNKIRLADMDSVIKVEKFDPEDRFLTEGYANYEDHISKKGNKYKIDIYSTAVTAIEHIMGEGKFKGMIFNTIDNSMNYMYASIALKEKYNDFTKTLKDEQLGKILRQMLNGECESMTEVLKSISKNKTMLDKKDLKIGLSYISNDIVVGKAVHLVSERKRIQEAMEKEFLFNCLRSISLRKLNGKIAKLLVDNSKGLDSTKQEFMKKLANKFITNDFTSNSFILTRDAIKKQQEKNIALESKFMRKAELSTNGKKIKGRER